MDRDQSDVDIDWDDLHPETRRMLDRRGFLRNAGAGAAGLTVFGGMFALVGCSKDSTTASSTSTPSTTAATTAPTTVGTAPKGTTVDGKTLYQRLGGNAALTAVVAQFVKNVGADKQINGFFANTDLTRLQALLVEQIGQATGGPEVYTGRPMKQVHAGLGITVADFNALVTDLVASLDQYNVPAAEKTELLNLLGPMQPDIVAT